MQTTSFGHRRQRRSFPTDVSEHLEYHEAQEQEVEAEAYPSYDDERHLKLCQGFVCQIIIKLAETKHFTCSKVCSIPYSPFQNYWQPLVKMGEQKCLKKSIIK